MASELTTIIANFSTTLAAKVTAGDVAGTLASASDKQGNALPTGIYGFTLNEGKSNEQHIKCLLTGTAMTLVKGVTHAGVESTGFLKDADINSKIKLTDFVSIRRLVEILDGQKALNSASPMYYDAEVSFTDRKQVISKGYADDLLAGSVGTASDSSSGTTKTTKNQGAKPKVHSVLVREQATPDKTLLVESFNHADIEKIVSYAGGNTPNFIDPGFGGDLAFALNPTNTETVVITVDGTAVTVTFVTSIGATPGNILIGGTAAITRANFVNFINNPTVTNANQVAVTGASLTAIQKLSATDDATLNAFIRATNPAVASFSVSETMAGAGNIWTANTTKNRIDLVVIDNAGTLQIRKGVEAVSPTVPTPTSGDIVLASVLNRCGMTTVRDYNVSGQSYITQFYAPSVYRTDILTSSSTIKHGGTGVDGPLVISSGVTNIDLGGNAFVVKNYTTISITGTASITFTNPHANGTIVAFKSQTGITITSSASNVIDMRNLGSLGGNAGNLGTSGIGGGGCGGASGAGNGANNGGGTATAGATAGLNGNVGTAQFATITGGEGGTVTSTTKLGGVVSSTPKLGSTLIAKGMPFCVGTGGGGAGGTNNASGSTAGNGGRGAGSLYMECVGAWNFTTSTINLSGTAGGNGAGSFGTGGGGGGGGTFLAIVGSITANSGTITTTGGAAGTGLGAAGTAGANGQSLVVVNTEFA